MVRILLIATLCATVSSVQQAQTGTIAGKVFDTCCPLPGATVVATSGGTSHTVYTDARGNYRIADLPPGAYQLVATLPGFQSGAADSIEVGAGRTTWQDIELRLGPVTSHGPAAPPSRGAVLGRVMDGSGGGLPGVIVTITGPGTTRKASTLADGTYFVADLPPGSFELRAELTGFVQAGTETIAVTAGVVTRGHLTMRLAPRLRPEPVAVLQQLVEARTGAKPVDCGQHRLRLLGPGSFAATDASVLQQSIDCGLDAVRQGRGFWTFRQRPGIDSWIAEGLLSENGLVVRFIFDDDPGGGSGTSPPNFYTERCSGPAVMTERKEVRFGCHERVLDRSTGVIAGLAIVENGDSLPGVTVTVTGAAGTWKAVTKADGTYTAEGLPPGAYRIDLALAGFRPHRTDGVEVTARQITRHDAALRLGVMIEGLHVLPVDGAIGAVKEASVIVHLEIVQSLAPGLRRNESYVATAHRARVLAVVKSDRPEIVPGATLTFDQLFAGVVIMDGRTVVGIEQPYAAGQRYVAFLRRNKELALEDFAGESFMFPASKGFVLVPQPGPAESGLRPTMTIDECLAALRKLLVAKNPEPR